MGMNIVIGIMPTSHHPSGSSLSPEDQDHRHIVIGMNMVIMFYGDFDKAHFSSSIGMNMVIVIKLTSHHFPLTRIISILKMMVMVMVVMVMVIMVIVIMVIVIM